MREKIPIVFVTGGSGFIGNYCINALVENGFKVKALTRNPDKVLLAPAVEIIVGSFENLKDWEKHLENIDCVINLAGEYEDISRMQYANFDGPAALLKSCIDIGINRWIQMSSVGAYGPVKSGVVTECCSDRPSGFYEKSKALFDDFLQSTAKKEKIFTTILRPTIIYGIDMKNGSLHQLISMIQKRLFVFVGPKEATANYVHVLDVAQALLLCLKPNIAHHKTYIVSNCGQMGDLINALAKGISKPPPRITINWKIVKLIAFLVQKIPSFPLTLARVEAFNKDVIYCNRKIKEELGWRPSVSLSAGMEALASSKINRQVK